MQYQVGRVGRTAVIKFQDGDEVLGSLVDVVKRENILSAIVYLIGGMKRGRFVVGPEEEKLPPVPIWRELGESHEIFGLGTIFWQDEEPKVHFHGAFGKRDNVRVGCLREDTESFLILEAVIIEVEGVNATREFDPAIGLSLLTLKS